MRFTEGILVGMPLLYFCFFVLLIITGVHNEFNPDEGKMLIDYIISGSGDIDEISDMTDFVINESLRTQPFDTEGGVFGTLSVATQGIGFIKNIINLELNLVTLPLQNVAGTVGTDTEIFNMLFWTLFVLPSHLLMGIAVLFFVRSG